MTDSRDTFPFGRPARVTPPAAYPAKLFILGAYPSALHIRWTPPSPHERVRALAVDVEPHAFWNGADQVERVEAWKRTVGWRADWGEAEAAGELNGSSGAWVDEHILRALGVSRDAAWITDCLHWYCASKGGARRIADTYAPFAIEHGLPEAVLPAHPSEAAIVRGAASEHARLREELRAAAPERVVTLGNAALRVLRELVDGELPKKLSADRGYGDSIVVRFEGRELEVTPLAHPAAPNSYQDAHAGWANNRAGIARR